MSEKSAFNQAMVKWNGLHRDQEYSLSPGDGTHAYIYSTDGSVSQPESTSKALRQAFDFEREAILLARRHKYQMGGSALLLAGISRENMHRALVDRSVSDIIVIGDGSFSAIYQSHYQSKKDKYITWQDVSDMASHLKLGKFTQRTCGSFQHGLSVPTGAFAMSKHSSVYSPLGKFFAPEECEDEDELRKEEAKIVQVYPHDALSLDYVKQNYVHPKLK